MFQRIYKCGGFQREKRVSYEKGGQLNGWEIETFSRQFVRDGDCSGENKKELNDKEHKERTHCRTVKVVLVTLQSQAENVVLYSPRSSPPLLGIRNTPKSQAIKWKWCAHTGPCWKSCHWRDDRTIECSDRYPPTHKL